MKLSKKRLRVYVDEYDPLVPEENKISFFVNKGEPLIAEILNNMTNAFNNTNIESKYIINTHHILQIIAIIAMRLIILIIIIIIV